MKNKARTTLLLLGDIVMLSVAFLIILMIAFPGSITFAPFHSHIKPFVIVGLIWIFTFFLFNLYETQTIKPTIPHLRRIGIASIVSLALSIVMFYAVPAFGITPKTNLVLFSLIFVSLFLAWRRFFYQIFSKYFRKKVIFITDTKHDNLYSNELIEYIKNHPQSGFVISGFHSNIQDFFSKGSHEKVDTLIISKNTIKTPGDLNLVYNRAESILDLAYAYEDILVKIPVDSIDETWFLHNIRGTEKALYENFVRVFNILFSVAMLTLTSPVLIISALMVKLEDGGSIFYTQTRVGKNGKHFKLYKLRSMAERADQNGTQWTEKGDPRITKVGRVLRKLHLDEVPQLWNIIRGDMALVGPRPEIPSFAKHLETKVPHYNLRHIIHPGFTGWAQIKYRNARGVAESKEKFEYDLYYIKNRNIFMDLGVIARTIQIIFTH